MTNIQDPKRALLVHFLLLADLHRFLATHVGQLPLLRRLAGIPIPPENFIVASIRSDSLGLDQPEPASADADWPERPG